MNLQDSYLSDRHQNLHPIDVTIQAANALSGSWLMSLGRQYLGIPFQKANYIQPVKPTERLARYHFLRLERVGNSKRSFTLQDLQTALTICHNPICHNPENYPLIFLLANDGKKTNVYLGTKSLDNDSHSSNFVDNLKDFLEGNWAGTKVQVCSSENDQFKKEIKTPLEKMYNPDEEEAHAVALTGIPAPKSGDTSGTIHNLNDLTTSLRGLPFVYMVIAKPIPELAVNQILYNLREITGQAHSLSKLQLSETFTNQILKEKEKIEHQLKSDFSRFSETENKSSVFGAALLASIPLRAIIAALKLSGAFFPLIGSLASLLDAIAESDLAKDVKLEAEISNKRSKQNILEKEQTHLDINDNIFAEKTGLSSGEAKNFAQEYINSHAQAALELIEQYIQRFKQARSLGCWNVGVYFLADCKKNAQRGGNLLRGLLSGQNSFLEPIRVQDLQRVWNKGHKSAPNFGAKDALIRLQQPSLGLVDPKTKESFDHILGENFNGLTTPLTTEELALLVNFPLESGSNMKSG